jgi:hypothetical protein
MLLSIVYLLGKEPSLVFTNSICEGNGTTVLFFESNYEPSGEVPSIVLLNRLCTFNLSLDF